MTPIVSHRSRNLFSKTRLDSSNALSPPQTRGVNIELNMEQDDLIKIDKNSDNSLSHRTGNITYTTINSEESIPEHKIKKNNNLHRNKQLWQIEKATLDQTKKIRKDLGSFGKQLVIEQVQCQN